MDTGAGLSTLPDAVRAADQATEIALRGVRTDRPDLAVVFASPHHAPEAQAFVNAVHDAASPRALIGCVAEAVVGGDLEIEEGPAASVWLGAVGDEVEAFHMEFHRTSSGGAFAGWRFQPSAPEEGGPVHLLIADPYTFPAEPLLRHLNVSVPGATVIGGMASGGRAAGETVLFLDRSVLHQGAVGVRLPRSIRVRTVVSQGCRPIGRSFVVTRAEGNVLLELGGRAPVERLRGILSELTRPDRELAAQGLHVGRVIDEYKAEHGTGDFLIRGVMGADPETGAIAVGDVVEVGQTVQFHVRDAATADEELRSMLERETSALPGVPAGALLFTCNGRGTRLFAAPHHDAKLLASYLGDIPVAGFFCAGELGPVGGKNFMHGFTASVAMFVDPVRTNRPPTRSGA